MARPCICGVRESRTVDERNVFGARGVLRCRGCRTLRLDPMPTPEEMEGWFSDGYYEEPERWGRRREPVFEDLVPVLDDHDVNTVVDVGAGYGFGVQHLKDQGFEARGLDVSRRCVEWGRKHLGVDLDMGSIGDITPADAAVALDTLYYVPDPERFVCAARYYSDLLVLRLRNPYGWLNEPMAWSHVWGFTPAGLRSLLAEYGWCVTRVRPASPSRHWTYRPRTWIVSLNDRARKQFGASLWATSYMVVSEAA